MERIQMAPGALHEFERLGYRADGLDRRIVQSSRSPGVFGVCHGERIPDYAKRDTAPQKILHRLCIERRYAQIEALSWRS
jgi:hypothetical protein